MVNAPAELIKVLNATVSTIRCASVSAWDDWGVIVNGTYQNVYIGKAWFCKDAKTDKTDRHCDIFPLPKSALDGNIKLKQNPGY